MFDFFLILSLFIITFLCDKAEAWAIQLLLLLLVLIILIYKARKIYKRNENKFFSKYDILNMNRRKIEKKLRHIGGNINIIKKNIRLLDELKNEDIKNEQNKLLEYLMDYFNEYLTILFTVLINENMEITKIINENKIDKIDVKSFIGQIERKVTAENKKITSFINDYQKEVSDEINNKIEGLKLELITLQSNILIKNISPIDNHYEIEKIKNLIGYETNKKNMINLDKKYEDLLIELKSINEIK